MAGVAEVTAPGWAALPNELLAKVFYHLQVAKPKAVHLGSCTCPHSVVRLVCRGWQVVHDALVRRLVLPTLQTLNAVNMGNQARLFPAVVAVDLAYSYHASNEGVRAVCIAMPALTALNLGGCHLITDKALQVVSSMLALTSLGLSDLHGITNAGILALSCLPALSSLDLRYCSKVTLAGVEALRSTTVSPNLHVKCPRRCKTTGCNKVALPDGLPGLCGQHGGGVRCQSCPWYLAVPKSEGGNGVRCSACGGGPKSMACVARQMTRWKAITAPTNRADDERILALCQAGFSPQRVVVRKPYRQVIYSV